MGVPAREPTSLIPQPVASALAGLSRRPFVRALEVERRKWFEPPPREEGISSRKCRTLALETRRTVVIFRGSFTDPTPPNQLPTQLHLLPMMGAVARTCDLHIQEPLRHHSEI